MAKKTLAEVDLSKIAVPVVEKPKGRKRKNEEAPPKTPPPEAPASIVSVTDVVKEKKPRTEKQLAADAKRRESALAKKKEKEDEEARIKEAEVAQLKAAEEKRQAAAAKRKAAREAKKSEKQDPQKDASEVSEDELIQPQASSVPPPKVYKPRVKEPVLVQVKERPKTTPRAPSREVNPEDIKDELHQKFDQKKYNEWMRRGQTYFGRQPSNKRLR